MTVVVDPDVNDRIEAYTTDWLNNAHLKTFSMNFGPFLSREETQKDGSNKIWLAIRVTDQHLNGMGFCHGGVLLTLADEALGINAYHAVDKRSIPTVSLQANFLQTVRKGELLEATATDIHLTNSLVFVQGCAMVGGEQVASMNAVFKILGEY